MADIFFLQKEKHEWDIYFIQEITSDDLYYHRILVCLNNFPKIISSFEYTEAATAEWWNAEFLIGGHLFWLPVLSLSLTSWVTLFVSALPLCSKALGLYIISLVSLTSEFFCLFHSSSLSAYSIAIHLTPLVLILSEVSSFATRGSQTYICMIIAWRYLF